jgi:hypothetical protein
MTSPIPPHALNDVIETAIRIRSRRLVGRAGFTAQDLDDIRQDLRLAVLAGMGKFDPARGTLNTFVTRVIKTAICQMIRHRRAPMRDRRCEAFSLNGTLRDSDGRAVTRANLIPDSDRTRRLRLQDRPAKARLFLRAHVEEALAGLPDGDRRLCRNIQRRGAADAPDLDDRIQRIRAHFAHAGLRVYGEDRG